jgi:hypothetical protein
MAAPPSWAVKLAWARLVGTAKVVEVGVPAAGRPGAEALQVAALVAVAPEGEAEEPRVAEPPAVLAVKKRVELPTERVELPMERAELPTERAELVTLRSSV